jgi:hypothetical protein
MCIDFTDLNKACPKDNFPLPRIDTLVDQAVRCEMLSFLDCFSGSKVYGRSLNLRRFVILVLELKNCIILVFKLCLGLILIQTGMGPHVSFFSHLLSLLWPRRALRWRLTCAAAAHSHTYVAAAVVLTRMMWLHAHCLYAAATGYSPMRLHSWLACVPVCICACV